MTIEKIVYGKKNVVIVTENGEYALDPDAFVLSRIKKGDEIDDNFLADVLSESELIACKKYLYEQIDRYSKTKKGYYDKLRDKGFSQKAAKNAINHATERGYIDDGRFAERFYEKYRGKKGITRIKNELRAKGVDKDALSFLDEETESIEEVLKIAEKFMKRREKTPEEKVKLLRHLSGKGFSFDVSKRADDEIFRSDD